MASAISCWRAALRTFSHRPRSLSPSLAYNLSAAWTAPGATTRARQQLLRALIIDIVVDVDDVARDVVLTIHWRGSQHSEHRVHKPRSGDHGCAPAEDALAVMRSMADRWLDEHIAASLNRMGLPTGQGKTWTAHRVASVRRVRGIQAYLSAEKDGEWLTMSAAARVSGVTRHSIRHLIKTGVLPAVQVVPGAPHQIRAADLASDPVKTAIARKGRPCRVADVRTLPIFPGFEKGAYNDRCVGVGSSAPPCWSPSPPGHPRRRASGPPSGTWRSVSPPRTCFSG